MVNDRLYGRIPSGTVKPYGFGNPNINTYDAPPLSQAAQNYQNSRLQNKPSSLPGINQPANRLPGPKPSPQPTLTPPNPPRPTSGPMRAPTTKLPTSIGNPFIDATAAELGMGLADAASQAAGRGSYEDRLQAAEDAYNSKTPAERKKDQDERWKKDPFNIFGDAWQWAPWNQGKKPLTETPKEPDANGDVPIVGASDTPGYFTVTRAKADRYFKDSKGKLYYQDTSASGTYTQYGIPVGLRYGTENRPGITVKTIAIGTKSTPSGQTIYTQIASYVLASSTPNGSGLHQAAPQISVSAGSARIAQDYSPVDIPASEQLPQPQLEPLAPPQYQPTGYPELPIPQFPYPSPRPFPNLRPSPAPNLSPSPAPNLSPNPYRDPTTQPTPFPKPTVDPTAPPTTQPNPFPLPFPSIQPNPNPGPQVRPQPQPNSRTTSFPAPNATPGNLEIPDFLKSYETVQSFDPGLPAPEADMCKDPCIKSMHDTSKGQKPKDISYKVFKKCGDNGPEFETKTMSVPANEADALKILLDDAADRKGEKCTTESNTLTIPEWWAVRPGADRPQFCIMYAEKFSTGKLGKSRWQLTIPHYNRPKGAKPQIPEYRKGNWMGTLTLNDNSKIRINAASATECRRVLNKLKILIPVDKRTINGKAIKPTILERADGDLKECTVTPIRGDFYKTGQKQSLPDWSIKLR